VLVPLISRATLKSDWVSREIDKRRAIFDERHANILPVETEPRLAERMAVGFTPITAGARGSAEERDSMAHAVQTIGAVVKGERPPPFRTLPVSGRPG
jgi:hypothetical protein